MGRFILSLFVLLSVSLKGQVVVSGLVSDAKTGEALFGATIFDYLSTRGGVTNAFGNFVFSTDLDSIHLQVSYIGYKTQVIKTLSSEIRNYEFKLTPSLNLEEVEIVGRIPFKQEGIKMDRKFIEALPQFLGESDVLKAAQFLPGVQRSSELSAGMIVRGGSPDQNLILLDGIPVYNAYHLFGLFSVFSPEMVQNSYLLKGGFPARYGGRLSSVMDIQTREGSKEKFGGSVGLGPVTSHVFLEGPIDSLSTFAISGRRTFLDVLITPLVLAETEGEAKPILKFQDFNFKLNRRLNRRDRIYLSAYLGKDKFGSASMEDELRSEVFFGWGNEMAMLRWIRNYDSGVFFSLKGYYSNYKFSTGFNFESDEEKYGFEYYSGIRDFALNADWETGRNSSLFRWGVKTVNHTFSPGVTESQGLGSEEDVFSTDGTKTNNVEATVYVEWEKSWSKKWKSNIGVNANTIAGQEYNSVNPDPRIKVEYLASENGRFFVAYSQLTQYIHLLTNPSISLPTDLWMPSKKGVPPGRSREVSIGYEYTNNGWKYETGIYHRYLKNIIELKHGSSIFSADGNWEENVQSGFGEAYGIELSLQKRFDSFYFGSAFTYARSLRKVEGINRDTWFPFKYDRPFYFTSFGGWDLRKNKKLSFAFNLSSGDRISLTEGEFYLPGDLSNGGFGGRYFEYSDRNEYQFPVYYRLDLSYDITQKKKHGERTWKFSVLNVLNRFNPAIVEPFSETKDNGKTISINSISVIPFFPSFKWTRTF